jgi:hypothetical protein
MSNHFKCKYFNQSATMSITRGHPLMKAVYDPDVDLAGQKTTEVLSQPTRLTVEMVMKRRPLWECVWSESLYSYVAGYDGLLRCGRTSETPSHGSDLDNDIEMISNHGRRTRRSSSHTRNTANTFKSTTRNRMIERRGKKPRRQWALSKRPILHLVLMLIT